MKTVAEKIKNIKFRTWKKCVTESIDFEFRTHSMNAVYDGIVPLTLHNPLINHIHKELNAVRI